MTNWHDIDRSFPPLMARASAEEARQDAEREAIRDRINDEIDRRLDRGADDDDAVGRMLLTVIAIGGGLLAGWAINVGFTALNAARIAGGW